MLADMYIYGTSATARHLQVEQMNGISRRVVRLLVAVAAAPVVSFEPVSVSATSLFADCQTFKQACVSWTADTLNKLQSSTLPLPRSLSLSHSHTLCCLLGLPHAAWVFICLSGSCVIACSCWLRRVVGCLIALSTGCCYRGCRRA